MRIGIEYTSAVTQGAGIGRLTRGLVRALERLDRKNDYTLLVTKNRANADIGLLASNFRLRQTPFAERAANIIWHRLNLPLSVERFTGQIDIFHATNFVLPRVSRARTVLTIHDLSYRHFPEAADAAFLKFINEAVPRSLERADLLVADSESTRQDIVHEYGFPADRIHVVYGGVEERFQRVDDWEKRDAVAMRYGIKTPAILAVGTLQPRKNLARLIEAYVMLREQGGFPHTLYIAGAGGWMYSDIFARIEDLGLQPHVKFLGFVRDEDLPTVYSLADAFVYPSLYEGFGFPVLEALACGVPVVCSNVSSIPEVGGDAVIYCDPMDIASIAQGIDRAVNDEALRPILAEKGRLHAQQFTWAAAGRSLLSVYQRLGAA